MTRDDLIAYAWVALFAFICITALWFVSGGK